MIGALANALEAEHAEVERLRAEVKAQKARKHGAIRGAEEACADALESEHILNERATK